MIGIKGTLSAFLTLVPFAYAALVGAIYAKQESLLFHPDRQRHDPASIGIDNARELSLVTEDGESLVAWYTAPAQAMPTILFLHGNGGSIAGRPERYRYFTGQGFGLLYLSWRGYGGSSGSPSEAGLMSDARAAYDWLVGSGLSPERLVLIGESLGSGIAVKLAAERPVAAIALEAPYSSMVDLAADHYWWLPARLLIRNPINAGAAIGNVEAPLLIQHGDQDRTVPIQYGRRLYNLAQNPKEFVVIPGADHAIFDEETFAREAAFFRETLTLPQ